MNLYTLHVCFCIHLSCQCNSIYVILTINCFMFMSDINECAEGLIDCHPYAGCLNKQGSYDCVCTGDYFGDGRTCYGIFIALPIISL